MHEMRLKIRGLVLGLVRDAMLEMLLEPALHCICTAYPPHHVTLLASIPDGSSDSRPLYLSISRSLTCRPSKVVFTYLPPTFAYSHVVRSAEIFRFTAMLP